MGRPRRIKNKSTKDQEPCRRSWFPPIPLCNTSLRSFATAERLRRPSGSWFASLAILLAQEATADLKTIASEVNTPLGPAATRVLADVVGIVPILRAGLGMADGVLELIPEAEVWHIGLYRDEAPYDPPSIITNSRPDLG